MNNNEFNYNVTDYQTKTLVNVRTFLSSVFLWMTFALFVTGIVAYFFGTSEELMNYVYKTSPETGKKSFSLMGYVCMFCPLIFVWIMGGGFARFSFKLLTLLFVGLAFTYGICLSTIFIRYTEASIYSTFFISSAMFGVMAIAGYTTNIDLSKFGSIMMMGLVGIIIASIVNWFIQSPVMYYVISFIGVLVFAGLTAYDMQKIKQIANNVEEGAETTKKLYIWGALSLYLDFIGIFIYLLSFLGVRKD